MNSQSFEEHMVTDDVINKWQTLIDNVASVFEVSAALIMRVLPEQLEVLVASSGENNPYEPHEKIGLNTGHYCASVLAARDQLLVPNALEDPGWKDNPDVKLNMISYLGIPLVWPDDTIFGTICVLDDKTRHFAKPFQELLWNFKSLIERDFMVMHDMNQLESRRENLEELVAQRTSELESAVTKLEDEVAARKEAEESLRESQERYHQLFETNQAIKLVIDPDTGSIIETNEAACNFYGYRKSELLSMKITDINTLPAADVHREMDAVREAGSPVIHFRHRLASGEIRHVHVYSGPVKIKGATLLYSIIHDVTEHMEAQEELLLFKTIADNANYGMGVMNTDGEFIYCNHAFAEMHGYTSEEVLGECWPIFHNEDQVEAVDSIINTLLDDGISYAGNVWHARKDGSIFPSLMNASVINSETEEPRLLAITAIDITAQRQAEDALRESEEKYRRIFETMEEGYLLATVEGKVIAGNPAAARLLKYDSPQQMEGMPLAEEVYVDEAERAALLLALMEHGAVKGHPLRFRQRDGGEIDIEGNIQLIRNRQGEPIAVEGTFCDVTERMRIQREHVRLEKAIDQAAESIIITDVTGNILYANPAFEKTSGFTLQEAKNQHPNLLGRSRDRDELFREVWETMRRGEIWNERFINEKKDGSLYHEDASVSPVFDSSGAIINFVVVKRDVTHEENLKRQLLQAHKMEALGTLAGGIAHDFNNILAAMIGYTELSLSDVPQDSELAHDLGQVLAAGRRAKDLVQQILTFSRHREHEKTPVQVNFIVAEAVKMLKASLPSTIKIVTDLDFDGAVMADPIQIHQIVMNLCTNAGLAMSEEGGVLEIGLERAEADTEFLKHHLGLCPGSYLRLEVTDTGCGMPRETLERIFDPFFTTRRQGKGSGMGLSVVHGIVQDHDGEITVSSRPGKGSTFVVHLPLIHRRAADVESTSVVQPGNAGHILFVDDEEIQVDVSGRMLEHMGHRVTAFTGPLEALEAFQADPHAFDLVITDMTMPEMTGDVLAGKLRSIRPDIPIVLFTGYSERISEDKIRELGVDGMLMKPAGMKEMADIVRTLLGK